PPSYWHDARESDLENSPLPSNVKVGDDILLPTARAARRRSSGISRKGCNSRSSAIGSLPTEVSRFSEISVARSDLQNLEHNIMVAMERQSMQVIEYVDTSLREVKLMIGKNQGRTGQGISFFGLLRGLAQLLFARESCALSRGTLHPSIESGLPTVLGSVTCVEAEYRSGTD
ncbi:hypothetical protein FOZ63_019689, partial [Perkinsus olseni]